MDKEVLVKTGHTLVDFLDQTSVKPRGAMWVHNPDNDIWRLWIVSQKGTKEPEFFRVLADTISKHRDELPGLDISSVELVDETHPAIQGLARFARVEGHSVIQVSNNTFDGFFLPDGIILLMTV